MRNTDDLGREDRGDGGDGGDRGDKHLVTLLLHYPTTPLPFQAYDSGIEIISRGIILTWS